MNRYLNGDPLPWLTDGENPAVTYLAKKEFSDNPNQEKLYSSLLSSKLTDYFRSNSSSDILGDRKNPDLFYKGTVWFFLFAVESGYDSRTDFISKTADYICKALQLDHGGFSFNWKPPVAVGCRTGNMVCGLLKAGINDERTKAGLEWIIKNQRADGGWLHCPFKGLCDTMKLVFLKKPGKGQFDDKNSSIPSCPVATYTCLNALLQSGDVSYRINITAAVKYFISINFFVDTDKNRSRCGLFTDPINPGYPVMSQFEIISLMRLITHAGISEHGRVRELYNYIIKCQNSEGRWDSINTSQGMIREPAGSSRWVTLNALRMIKSVTEKENQLENA